MVSPPLNASSARNLLTSLNGSLNASLSCRGLPSRASTPLDRLSSCSNRGSWPDQRLPEGPQPHSFHATPPVVLSNGSHRQDLREVSLWQSMIHCVSLSL